jgi:hypothetical protein
MIVRRDGAAARGYPAPPVNAPAARHYGLQAEDAGCGAANPKFRIPNSIRVIVRLRLTGTGMIAP